MNAYQLHKKLVGGVFSGSSRTTLVPPIYAATPSISRTISGPKGVTTARIVTISDRKLTCSITCNADAAVQQHQTTHSDPHSHQDLEKLFFKGRYQLNRGY